MQNSCAIKCPRIWRSVFIGRVEHAHFSCDNCEITVREWLSENSPLTICFLKLECSGVLFHSGDRRQRILQITYCVEIKETYHIHGLE